MVNAYGKWIEEKDYTSYPEEKWCDYDRMAAWIRETGYEVKTTMENLITMIFLYFCNPETQEEYDYLEGTFTDKCKAYVMDSGGLSEFDFEC